MSNDEIIWKLARYTYENPKDEASVVYLMVQIGKIIEREGYGEKFPTLWFYRNWIVHYQLDRKDRDARREMLNKLEEAILIVIAQKNDEILKSLGEAISLNSLHKEMASFFRAHRLEKQGFDYLGWFKKFDALLIAILSDLPLIPPRDSGYSFEEFRFKASPTGKTSEAEFEIKLPNNKTLGGKVVVKISGKVQS
jgi:hypothetical protein